MLSVCVNDKKLWCTEKSGTDALFPVFFYIRKRCLILNSIINNTANSLLTAREGNVFTDVCHSAHIRPHCYSVTAHPCSYWNAFLLLYVDTGSKSWHI